MPLEETPVNNDREVKDEIMFSVIKNRVRITTSQKHVGGENELESVGNKK